MSSSSIDIIPSKKNSPENPPLDTIISNMTLTCVDTASSSKSHAQAPDPTMSVGSVRKSVSAQEEYCKQPWSLGGLERALPETLADLTECRSSDPLQFMGKRLYHSFNVKLCHDEKAAFPAAVEETLRELENEKTTRQQRMDYCRLKIQEYQKVLVNPAQTATKSKQKLRRKKLKKKKKKLVAEEGEEEEAEDDDTDEG